MQEDRGNLFQETRSIRSSATLALLIANILAYIIQVTVLPTRLYEYLVLSLDGLKHWYLWQLITFQFLHGGIVHLTVNCWALYLFGREVEWVLGKPRFLALYFSSGVVGGLLHAFAALVWPQYFDSPVVGASAGIFGVVAAFAMFFPDRRLIMLLFFIIPINMRAKSLLWFCLILTVLGISFQGGNLTLHLFGMTIHNPFSGGNVAHAAHLGGILTGLAFSAGTSDSFLEARNRERLARP
jgi:membrane associated rhomboid family serine protease